MHANKRAGCPSPLQLLEMRHPLVFCVRVWLRSARLAVSNVLSRVSVKAGCKCSRTEYFWGLCAGMEDPAALAICWKGPLRVPCSRLCIGACRAAGTACKGRIGLGALPLLLFSLLLTLCLVRLYLAMKVPKFASVRRAYRGVQAATSGGTKYLLSLPHHGKALISFA